MTWPISLTEMVREEFASARRRGRGVFDRAEDEPIEIEPRVDIEPRARRRVVSGRSSP
jgi:hypothetical protein